MQWPDLLSTVSWLRINWCFTKIPKPNLNSDGSTCVLTHRGRGMSIHPLHHHRHHGHGISGGVNAQPLAAANNNSGPANSQPAAEPQNAPSAAPAPAPAPASNANAGSTSKIDIKA